MSGGNKTAQDFTLHIVVTSGQGSASPSDFQGSESGTTVTFSDGALYDLAANQDPDYTRTYGSDCPATGSQFPSSFTCHVIYTYNPSTTSPSGTPPSSSAPSSSQQPLTNLVPQDQRLNPESTNSTSLPSPNSTTTSPSSAPLTSLAPSSPPITQGAMTSNKTTQQPHSTTSITPQSTNATNSTTTAPSTSAPSTTTNAPSTLPGNQTTNSSTGLKTFYVYVHMNNQGGGTKTAKDATVSWPTIFNGEPCGITATRHTFNYLQTHSKVQKPALQ